ncbi:MAG TPA: CHAT domain-containing protein [Granulicella sp.]
MQPKTILSLEQIEQIFISGDLPSAEQAAEAAAARYRTTDPTRAQAFRAELAKIYLYQGRSVDVVELLSPSSPSDTSPEVAIRRHLLLAMGHARLGHPTLTAEELANAAALHPTSTLQTEMLNIQGAIALEQGSLDAARSLLQQALDLAHRQDSRYLEMEIWMNLGVVGLQLERYEDALQSFQHASTLAQAIGARLAREKALGNLGWTYYLTGDDARALENALAARTMAASIGATLDEVQWSTNAGESQFRENDLRAARSSYEHALMLAESLHNTEEMLDTHISLAYLLLRQHSAQAEAHIREASQLAAVRNHAEESLQTQLLQCLLLIEKNQLQDAATSLLALIPHATAPSIQWEAENTLAGVYERQNRSQDAEYWFQRAIATFHKQRLSLRTVELELPFLENGSGLYLGYMEHLIHQGRTAEALRVLDNSRAEVLAEGLGDMSGATPAQPDPRSLAARLHGTVLVYCLREHTSYLWAITPQKQQLFTLPGSETILPLLNHHTQAILDSKDLLAQTGSTGRQLYDLLVQPAAALLPHDGRVYLIADHNLGGLNFETLIPPGPQPHYWIEDVTLINARSLRLLGARPARAARPATQRLLLIGNPVYRPQEYPSLPNAAAEVTQVASTFPASQERVVTGPSASPAAYASSSPADFSYIHFVAHATASEINPLDSAIILSSPNSTTPNKLYARDILAHPLHAELVTLSSCYGSGTRSYAGEGIVGLVWAFLRAGAHTVIGAMWEVSDLSTPQLMNGLYSRMLAGSSPDEALRQAKLAMLRGSGIYRKPLYWAAFQVYTGR